MAPRSRIFRSRRNVLSGFGEINAPLISPEMGIPFVQKVSIDVSAATTSTAMSARPSIRNTASTGPSPTTSSCAATIRPPSWRCRSACPAIPARAANSRRRRQHRAASPVPVSAFPSVASAFRAAPAWRRTVLQPGRHAPIPGLIRQYGSALANAKPQTGNGVNIGFDFTPTFLPGLIAQRHLLRPELQGRYHRAQHHPDRQHAFGAIIC